VGQSVIQGARIAGAARIIAIDPGANKREASVASGATDLVDPSTEDVEEAVRRATGGRGADFSFEVVGKPETIATSFGLARRGGTVALVGMPAATATVTMSAFLLAADDKRLCGSYYGGTQARVDFPRIIELAETGRLDMDAMVTRRLPLSDVNDALRALEAGEEIRSVVVL
jgi:S-(hydroxymethyl)glutathione dehydrogenase/alcohol dehydrogenase